MRLWPPAWLDSVSPASGDRARRAGRMALFAVPFVAVAVFALAATGVLSTFAAFTASITNTENHVQTGTVGLTEKLLPGGPECSAPADGQWTVCGPDNINKYGGGELSSSNQTESQMVRLTNTGSVAAHLFLLPSACVDEEAEGAGGPLCNIVSIKVSCTNGTSIPRAGSNPPDVTLNAFFADTPTSNGYPIGELAANGGSTECTFTLTLTGSIPGLGGSISQELTWKLTALP